MNLYAQGLLDQPLGLAAAALIGLLFGFWLERAGFGSSRKLAAIFYLRDFAVLKVMFTALLTAAIGLQVLGIDVTALYRPETVIWPQVVGGLLFGAGFVTGGWCPGTAVVGLATGKLDALFFLVGGGAGSLLFAAAYPAIEPLTQAGSCGVLGLPDVLGLPTSVVTALVAFVALSAFALANLLERRTNPVGT